MDYPIVFDIPIQLTEIVTASHGALTLAELREHWTIRHDWAGRECLTASDAQRALASKRKPADAN